MLAVDEQQPSLTRPSNRVWIVAVTEIAVAVVVARLMLSSYPVESAPLQHHRGMPAMPQSGAAEWHWSGSDTLFALAVVIGICWFVARGSRTAATTLAVSFVALISSGTVRVAAGGSHLVAMLVLEASMTVVPLLLVFAARERLKLPTALCRSRALLAASALAYGATIIAIHLPTIHAYVMAREGLPIWLISVAIVVAVVFWQLVLHGLQRAMLRRRALIGAQEIAAFVGLLSLFSAWPTGHHAANTLTFGAWDQRLGGIVMLGTCGLTAGLTLRRIGHDIDESLE